MPAPAPKKPTPPPSAQTTREPEYVPVDENGKEQAKAALEPFETYTEEEIAGAKQSLADMTEQELLQNQQYIRNLEEQIKLPEAGAVAFATLVGPQGGELHVTTRAASIFDAIDQLLGGVKYAHDKYKTVMKKGPSIVGGKTQTVAAQDEQAKTGGEGGSRVLERIVVTSDRIDFYLAGWQWPVPDHRVKNRGGAKLIADMFDKDLGWTEDHFANTCEYKGDDVKDNGRNLIVDYIRTPKKDKDGYWTNITRIHVE